MEPQKRSFDIFEAMVDETDLPGKFYADILPTLFALFRLDRNI